MGVYSLKLFIQSNSMEYYHKTCDYMDWQNEMEKFYIWKESSQNKKLRGKFVKLGFLYRSRGGSLYVKCLWQAWLTRGRSLHIALQGRSGQQIAATGNIYIMKGGTQYNFALFWYLCFAEWQIVRSLCRAGQCSILWLIWKPAERLTDGIDLIPTLQIPSSIPFQ